MKKIRLTVIRAIAAVVFVFAFMLNIHTNLEGETTLFGQLLVANSAGSGGSGGSGPGETLYFKKVKNETYTQCPIVKVQGTRWVGVSGDVQVGTIIKGYTVIVNANGQKGYYEEYEYYTNGVGNKVTCPDWTIFSSCTPGVYCPGTGDGPYIPQ
ncbi:MAG TPA: hypothetical protein VNQ80_03685 [Parapedobacter sp.]|uniref:hypothetical protein n=1 Tax=Parapedobacter sp. TaxID=1958893 RepID=UPI002BED00C1|nr:hypothetical protein [Parapedobacter sp.]HWK56410.1 hypothetical protein [Parapedobacter sp.]